MAADDGDDDDAADVVMALKTLFFEDAGSVLAVSFRGRECIGRCNRAVVIIIFP